MNWPGKLDSLSVAFLPSVTLQFVSYEKMKCEYCRRDRIHNA